MQWYNKLIMVTEPGHENLESAPEQQKLILPSFLVSDNEERLTNKLSSTIHEVLLRHGLIDDSPDELDAKMDRANKILDHTESGADEKPGSDEPVVKPSSTGSRASLGRRGLNRR